MSLPITLAGASEVLVDWDYEPSREVGGKQSPAV